MSEIASKIQQIDEMIITLEAKKQKIIDEYNLVQRNIDELGRQADRLEAKLAQNESVVL